VLNGNCPSCGAPIAFRSAGLPIVVCDFCRSTVMRRGPDLELIGVAARVPETITPLQIGSRGTYDGTAFELIGRVRWQWRDAAGLVGGGWSEWLALFADGRAGWLAEAMGRYTMTTELAQLPGDTIVARLAAGDTIVPGTLVELAGTSYRVIDARTAEAVGSEGELPFAAPAGETLFGVDLANGSGGRASLQKHGDAVTAWIGSAIALRDLQPKGLRRIDGWQLPGWAA
jgi:hypothetical protein